METNLLHLMVQPSGSRRKPPRWPNAPAAAGSSTKVGDVDDDVVEVVAGPDHRVAEPERRRRELDRHERLLSGLVELQLDGGAGGGALILEDAVDHGGPADSLEEVVDDHPLVVPADPAP